MERVAGELPVTVIEPRPGWLGLDLGEIWEYRELLFFLVWRDVKVRYKQTILGASWAILQPFMTMVLFSVFFGKLAGVPSDDLPYPLFSYAALVPWTFFASGLTQSSNSLVGSSNLIRKIYFPRLVVPVSSVLSGGVDFLISFAMLVAVIMPWFHFTSPTYGFSLSADILWLPLLLLLALVTALGVGLWLSALNVQFRDVRYTLPFLVQMWLFATPIAYPSSLLSEKWQIVYALNPMVGVVEGFRWALLGTDTAPGPMIAVSAVTAVVLLVTGTLYFRRMEKSFADVI
jgi:lipopolysaccharide transport system permease protein